MILSRIASLFLLLTVGVCAQKTSAREVPETWRKGFESIDEASCREWLGYLAGPECEGRGAGTPGYMKAARFLAARFKEAGLKPIGDKKSYFQGVPFNGNEVIARESVLRVGRNFKIKIGRDLSLEPAKGRFEGEALFVVAEDSAKLPDPKMMRNRVLILDVPSFPTSPILRQAMRDRPRAILIVAEKVESRAWKRGRRPSRNRVFGVISRKAARRLAAKLKAPKDCLLPLTQGAEVRVREASGPAVRITVASRSLELKVPNVVGFLPGSDPRLRKQVVVIGSHLDHLGRRGGQVYPGADDDGSGSTALIAVAKAFAANGQRPKRSLLFLAFTGEELGLLGSKYHVEHPIIPLKRMVCELQMDMIGRNEEKKGDLPEDNLRTLHLVGSKRLSSELHKTILDINQMIGFEFEYDEEGVYSRSDHYNFAKNGIPIAFFFSGFHPDYHKPSDTIDKINFKKLSDTARLVYLTAARIANQKKRLRVDN